MGIFKLVTGRNKKETTNQEFKVRGSDDFNDKIFRGYSQEEKKMLEFDIIDNIEKDDYRTKNSDGTFTKCEVGEKEGVKYLTSKPNGSTSDNILNLPKYK